MKFDPCKHEERYRRWRAQVGSRIPDLTGENSNVILRFLDDMERGLNVHPGSRKGGRSYCRLNGLHSRLTFLARHLEARGHASLVTVPEAEVHDFFSDMRCGTIAKKDGSPYLSTGDFVKVFKAFWHWYMRVQKKLGNSVPDICTDLDASTPKPKWVYLTQEDIDKLCRHAKFYHRVLITFLFDSGIRSPTELINIRVQDLTPDCTQLTIRDSVSKTFGRTIKLLLSPDLLQGSPPYTG